MASLCESVVVARCSSFGTSVSVPVKASTICSLLCERKVRCLPEPKGLRIQSRSLKRSVMASRIADRAGVVVCEAQKTAVEVPAVTEATWQSFVLESDMPVLVEFWAPWCGPCRMIDPIITELSKTYAGKLKCFKLNTDESPSIATQYGIRSIPTVIVFKNGEKKDAVIGAVPKSTLIASIDKFL